MATKLLTTLITRFFGCTFESNSAKRRERVEKLVLKVIKFDFAIAHSDVRHDHSNSIYNMKVKQVWCECSYEGVLVKFFCPECRD